MRTVPGDPVTRLSERAADADVVAVVIGARGLPAGRRPAGHVAVELLTRCDKPVVVVPPDVPCPRELRRMVVALEGSSETSRVLGPTVKFGHGEGIEVIAVHVDDEASMPLFSDQPQHETDAFVKEFLARYGPTDNVPPALELRIGEPAEQVLAMCEETAADMVVVAWSCSLAGGHARFVRHLLEHARIPILLIPTQGVFEPHAAAG
jgi:nucleotide-binding universal stress UspA family protein